MAEHERTKDPLPTRPRGGHPGFVLCLTDDERAEISRKLATVNKRSEHPTR